MEFLKKYFEKKRFEVFPLEKGLLFRDNKLEREMDAGIFELSDRENRLRMIKIPLNINTVQVTNQEVISKDGIAFRFSFYYSYQIKDYNLFVSNYILSGDGSDLIYKIEAHLSRLSKIIFRDLISSMDSEGLNENRAILAKIDLSDFNKEVEGYGVHVSQLIPMDLTFPKSIQGLFAKTLEAKIRSKTELENARTTIATARALKNVSKMMKDDPDIKFIKYLETITKISQTGRHNFSIGEVPLINNNNQGKSGK